MKSHKSFICFSLIFLASLYGCLTPSAHETTHHAQEICPLVLAGNVQRVIRGTVRAQDMANVTTERLLFALGGATPNRMEEIGECILIAGQGYTKSNDPERDYRVVTSNNIRTPFLMGIGSLAQPAEVIYLEESQSIEELYQDLSTRYDFFAVAGIGEFQELSTTALKKAPIYGEEITAPENRNNYFHPVKSTTRVKGIFFGIAQTAPSARINKDSSQRMFYINFANVTKTPALHSHTHVAIVNDIQIEQEMKESRQQILSTMTNAHINDVRHLLTQSRLKRAVIMVYQIEEVNGLN